MVNDELAKLLKYMELIHKGVVNAARIKHESQKEVNTRLARLKKDLKQEKYKNVQKDILDLYGLIDGLEKPLFASIKRHSKNYKELMAFNISKADNDELKHIINSFANFIHAKESYINELISIFDKQIIILNEIKLNRNYNLNKGVEELSDLQNKINHIYLQLEKDTNSTLLPLFHQLMPPEGIGKKLKNLLQLPSKKEIINAYNTNDMIIKYNVALAMGEVIGTFGSVVGAWFVYSLSDDRIIGAVIGNAIGNYVFAIITFIPTWYVFNMKKIFRDPTKVYNEHITLIKDTLKIIGRNIPAVIATYAFEAVPIAALSLFPGVHPSVAAAVGSKIGGTPFFMAVSTITNYKTLKTWDIKKIKIEEELNEAYTILVTKTLNIQLYWIWNSKELSSDYIKKLKGLTHQLDLVSLRIKKEIEEISKDSPLTPILTYLLLDVENIEQDVKNLRQLIEIKMVHCNHPDALTQKYVAQEINSLRTKIINDIKNLVVKIKSNNPIKQI